MLGAVEGRWYYRMKKRVNENIQQANITGEYVSIKAEHFSRSNINFGLINSYLYRNPSATFADVERYSLNWGKQFGNTVDFGISVGVKKGQSNSEIPHVSRNDSDYSWFIKTTNQIGIGFLFSRKQNSLPSQCGFLLCNSNVNHLLKLNLGDFIYFDASHQRLKLDVSYEQKIPKTAFSLNSTIQFLGLNTLGRNVVEYRDTVIVSEVGVKKYSYKIPVFSDNLANQAGYTIGLRQQIRYYFGMSKRVQNGKSGDNLNGFYTGAEAGYFISKSINQKMIVSITDVLGNTTFGEMLSTRVRHLGGIIGYQTQTSKKSYLDFSLLIRNRIVKTITSLREWSNDDFYGSVYIELSVKMGLAR